MKSIPHLKTYITGFALGIFFLYNLSIDLIQYNNFPLMGDMTESVLPLPNMEKVMQDPFGIETIVSKEYTHNPNRFFSHWFLNKAFRIFPQAFQLGLSPIDSVYATSALCKLLFQLSLVLLICYTIAGRISKALLLPAILLIPLFQTKGLVQYIGLVDPSIAYTFFYILPTLFIILYFLPLIQNYYHNKEIVYSWKTALPLLILAILASFSGPLNPGIALIVTLILVFQKLISSFAKAREFSFFYRIVQAIRSVPGSYYYYLLPISLLSLYSLYLGTFNSAKFWETLPLSEMYQRLPQGLFLTFIETPWFFLLGFIASVNIYLIVRQENPTAESQKIIATFKWVALFAAIYILLLPLGGYRSYRPFIIRYDTFMPVTILIFFTFVLSTNYVLTQFKFQRGRIWYVSTLAIILLVFTINDIPDITQNDCERAALEVIAQSPEEEVILSHNCGITSWETIHKPEDSYYNGQMLYLWNITDKPKTFYYIPPAE
jgi:hypothetical protein